jgi:hypothetical protein
MNYFNFLVPQPLFTGISPVFSIRHEMNISGFGLNLELAKNCSFYDNKEKTLLLFETAPIYVYQIGSNSSSSLLCHVPFHLTQNRSSIFVTLKNAQYEINTNGFTIEFYGIFIYFSHHQIHQF